jgi:hypothetical protein
MAGQKMKERKAKRKEMRQGNEQMPGSGPRRESMNATVQNRMIESGGNQMMGVRAPR